MPEETNSHQALRSPERPQNKYWVKAGFFASLGAALLGLLAMVTWRLSQAVIDVAAPFVFATVFALLLDPVVDRLQKHRMRRGVAVGAVFGIFLIIVVGVGSVAIPALSSQISDLADNGPKYISNLENYTNNFLAHHERVGGYKLPPNFTVLTRQLSANVSEILSHSAGHITTFLLGSITMLLDIVVMLIVTFYLLMDIDRFRARLLYLAPEKARGLIRSFAHDIGQVFSSYVRGLLIVSSLYGVFTLLVILGLSLVHREMAGYALLVGVAGGLLYSVPYLGPLVTALITFLVAFAAGGIGFGGVGILVTLCLNQVFDNVITPRVVGGEVGLHPVASLFALTLGGALFGLWGLMLSVPVAASVQLVLFRLFPKLTTPTPESFLREQDVPVGEERSAKILTGDPTDSTPT